MADFKTFKPKMPSNMGAGMPNLSHTASAEASATMAKPVQKTAPQQSQAPKTAPQQAPAQSSFRPLNRDTQINIPDFLKNKR